MINQTPIRKKKLAFELHGFTQRVKDVASMPAEKPIEAVSKKLMELNPGFEEEKVPRDPT